MRLANSQITLIARRHVAGVKTGDRHLHGGGRVACIMEAHAAVFAAAGEDWHRGL